MLPVQRIAKCDLTHPKIGRYEIINQKIDASTRRVAQNITFVVFELTLIGYSCPYDHLNKGVLGHMKSSILNFRSAILTAILTTAVTSAVASSNQVVIARPIHTNTATPALGFIPAKNRVAVNTPVWPVPVPPTNGAVAVNTPVWPVPVPPTNGVATPVWPVPVPPTNGAVAVNTPVWPVPVPPTNGVATPVWPVPVPPTNG
jgi:hypothetical protein